MASGRHERVIRDQMMLKKTFIRFGRRLHLDAWRFHYEVIVIRQQAPHLLARVGSRTAAERLIARTCRQVELSRMAFRVQRVRGVHPLNLALLCVGLLLVVVLLPGLWLRASLSLICIALTCGLLSSGRQWRQGGMDDR